MLFQQLRNIKLEIKLEPISHEINAGPSSHSLKPKKANKKPTTSPGRQANSPTHEAVDNQITTVSTSENLEPRYPNNDQLLHNYSTDTEVDTENENENEHNISHTTHDQSEQSERSDRADDDHTVPASEESDQSAKLSSANKINTREPSQTESDPEQETDQINANKKQIRVKHKRARIDSNDEDTDTEPPKKKANQGNCSARSTASTSDDTEPDMTSDTTKKRRKFKCPQCTTVEYSIHDLNEHFRQEHDPVRCPTCGKPFNTPSGLHKHSYIHQNRPYKCDKCNKAFPFYSQLKSHQVSHLDQTEYTCSVANCGKHFKRKNEYDRHMAVHDEVEHCCNHPGCDYKNYDERNLVAHQKIHTPHYKRYVCLYCSKGFLHYTQRTRHYANECTKIPKTERKRAQAKVN